MKFIVEIIKPTRSSKEFDKYIFKISPENNLDSNNIDEFEFILVSTIEGGVKKIIIDIEELNYIDSYAIGKLINITKKIRQVGGELAITRYSSSIYNIVRIINMEKYIKFFPTNDEGVEFLYSLEED
ncbi:MAG: STAS domain-containing protein [bacterium]|nr:STAS domain-containing protein [bacterium]